MNVLLVRTPGIMQGYARIGKAFRWFNRGRDVISRCCFILYKFADYYFKRANPLANGGLLVLLSGVSY